MSQKETLQYLEGMYSELQLRLKANSRERALLFKREKQIREKITNQKMESKYFKGV